MSGHQIGSFLNGATLTIKIGGTNVAFAQSISFSDNMSVQPVGGIGSYSYQNLEPLMYTARGSLQIMRYLCDANSNRPSNVKADHISNGLLVKNQFNPIQMLLSSTFDIDVSVKTKKADGTDDEKVIYRLKDCRLSNFSMGFSPGQLLSESVDYVCLQVVDMGADGKTIIQD
jgi:hypothetical protein